MHSGQFGSPNTACENTNRNIIEKRHRLGSDHISKIWSPLRQSLPAEKDAVLGWVWGFFTTTIDWWANAVVWVAVEMAFHLRTLPYFCTKLSYHTYKIR